MTTGTTTPLAFPGGSSPAVPPDDGFPAGAGPDDDADASAAEKPEPVYTALEDWLTDYFLPMFRRTLGGEYRWCHQWWQHGEAISRLTALWHAWEVLRLQPGTGIATWYRDHLDHQLPILMGTRGPFCQCSETAHRDPREAAATPAPEGWWDTDYYDIPADPSPGDAGTGAVTASAGAEPDYSDPGAAAEQPLAAPDDRTGAGHDGA